MIKKPIQFLLVSLFVLSASYSIAQPLKLYKTLEWVDLLPEEDLKLLKSIPQVDHEKLSEEELAKDNLDQINQSTDDLSDFENQIAQAISDSEKAISTKERTWKDALVSTAVRPEYNNQLIRIAGYISPITWNESNVITELFLVPYFGACIHVPPPPPNQIIYIRFAKGLKLDALYSPFWVEGKLIIKNTQKEIGSASYSMENVSFSVYQEQD
jgi:uncharacterized protein